MNLDEKIKQIYSTVTDTDFTDTIILVDDGNGPYIHTWNHPTLAKPTQEQLDAIGD
jgi:hypothetical protein